MNLKERKGDLMELMEAIKTRRSVRKFTDEPVPREKLEKIIEAAMWAPSGQNLQPWYFVALPSTGAKRMWDALSLPCLAHL